MIVYPGGISNLQLTAQAPALTSLTSTSTIKSNPAQWKSDILGWLYFGAMWSQINDFEDINEAFFGKADSLYYALSSLSDITSLTINSTNY